MKRFRYIFCTVGIAGYREAVFHNKFYFSYVNNVSDCMGTLPTQFHIRAQHPLNIFLKQVSVTHWSYILTNVGPGHGPSLP